MTDIVINDAPTATATATPPSKRQRQESFVIPTEFDYETCDFKQYSVPQLKEICKLYKLRRSCPKAELIANLQQYFKQCCASRRIQRCWRGYLWRQVKRLRGPAVFTRSLCVNSTDFSTLEEVSDIAIDNFFSLADEDQHVYGFEINSLLHLYASVDLTSEPCLNPYNRRPFARSVWRHLKRLVKYAHWLQLSMDVDESVDPIKQKQVCAKHQRGGAVRPVALAAHYDDVDEANQDARAMRLFHRMDDLGNYTQASWYTTLSSDHLRRFLIELYEIWRHRLQLTENMRRQIVPLHLEPFRHFRPSSVLFLHDVTLREYALRVMEIMVYSGVDRDAQTLGANYVLGALTQVHPDAARALPWLHEAMAPFPPHRHF